MSWDPLEAGGGWGEIPAFVAERRTSPRAYTVSAVNAMARRLLEGSVPPLWVAGEVAGWKRYASGHCYFSLRDASARLRCVMFRADAQRLPTEPEEGMQVRALGTLTLYERGGDFQLIVRELEGKGAGGLWRLAFERLRSRLEAEGLLAPERKRPLPRFPATVGVITSPSGAALHDILHVIERRAPWTRVLFCPARVQGDGAAQDLARAMRLFASVRMADVLIIGRGGGSVEDLWVFNEEAVARAIAASPVPVVSAVGHEVDVTIADLVADVRAPTPSAAAERVVPDGAAVGREVALLAARLGAAARRRVSRGREELTVLRDRLGETARAALRAREKRLEAAAGKLDALSPLAALRRGYAVPLGADGRILRTTRQFRPGAPVRLRVVDGRVDCTVDQVWTDAATDGRQA
ncbi:MAG TPA: exodeoxyribonuclease VII large subunit [Longimicrobiales bacterium]